MELIRLENVKKIYQTGEVITKAVDGIDFTVDQGEFALIIGASGAAVSYTHLTLPTNSRV